MKVHVLIERNKQYDKIMGVFSSPERANELVPIFDRKFATIYDLEEHEIDKKIKK